MLTLQYRTRESSRHCGTCRYYSTKPKHPSDTSHPEPFCPILGIPLEASDLVYTFCAAWDRIQDEEARAVYEELTGMRL